MTSSTTRGATAAARIAEVVDEILGEVHRMPADLVTWKPAADVWSVIENLCHVDEFIVFWSAETDQIVGNPSRAWGRDHTDARRIAAVSAAPSRTLDSVEATLRAGVATAAATLGRLSDADLEIESESKNPRWGRKPAGYVVDHLLVGHVEKHLGQIRRNVKQYAERHGGAA
jgi:hypothetical protein